MRIKVDNSVVDIRANMKADGDYLNAVKVAEKMIAESEGDLVMVEADDWEGYIVMSSLGGYKKREEWLSMYKEAKAAI